MHRGSIQPLRTPLARRLLPLAYALVVVVALILGLTWITVQAQTALAGFLNGESIWSKAQKQAVIDLLHYAATGDAADYTDFEKNYAVLKSLRTARDMVLSGHFDYQSVEDEMRRANAMTVAIPNAIFMLDHFADAPYMGDALRQWRSTDDAIAELSTIADGLRRAYARGTLTPAEAARQRGRITALNAFIAPRANQFSLDIAAGAVWSGRVLFIGTMFSAGIAIVLWLWMARRVLAGVRGSEERYRLLFDSAADAIVMVDEESGSILAANRMAAAWTGRDPEALLGVRYEDLFVRGNAHEDSKGPVELRGPGDTTRPVETQSSTALWGNRVVRQAIIRDISERVASDRERRIAAEALASIAEGIMIADPQRRLLSVNAAVPQITGFDLDSLADMRLDDTRSMPDGTPLPESVWKEVAAARYWSSEVLSRRKDGSTYPEQLSISAIRDSENRVQHYVAVFSDISVAKADRRRLEYLATHDPLTGLVNRAEFQRLCGAAIARAARERGSVVVMFIDLDAFKFVNDSYSHAVGDSLLKQVAERIRQQLGEHDVIGRIGGDEFTVLLSGQMLREDAAGPASRLLAALSEPFQVEGYEVALSASIGIAGSPLDGDDALTLMANADAAMYAAKQEERNAWRFYAPMMQADTRQRMLMATELRQALANDEFTLVYQPSVELRTGRIVAVEALLRWQHPERGEVLPGEFIPVAESIGLIHRIDEWVMHAVCAQIRAWDATHVPGIRVALNVSARWLSHPGFVESVRRALHVNGVEPGRIALEITEGAMLRLGEGTERTMCALHSLGIGVAIDDFGTGYASMAYLKLPAVTYLKIDRSFITGLPDNANDAAITGAMLAMAGSLGLITIAEGLENEAQHEFLLRAGCAEGQGYLYSYPLPPAALERMLKPKAAGGAKLKLVPPVRS
ncbi:MAG: diguanylate cyclase/phosphodiesterase (GGDEF & EAL domains) with PAS/PAC sensor(s) [Rhodanobacteraceae bacterium]|jgi:diguanylate cyclase (GGDEF)-like protein/PAS domain S-box-containing protein|nr:MAG: diguanylate cyclase/phosphodiesterase (GGDEF & EAL domains) with PAS/PAC sensor(s) [Rhodanobacteraceae bacterium]